MGHWFRWVYLRKRTDEGPFELFSDTASRVRHLRRVLALVLPILILNLFAGLNSLNQVGVLNLLLALFLAAGAGKLWRKIKALQAQQDIFE